MVCEIPLTQATDEDIVDVLTRYKKVAVIGLSPKSERASHRVAKYLMDNDYDIIPVNPMQDEILGKTSYASLLDIPGEVEVVDIFRKPNVVMDIVEQAIKKGAKVIWMQEGIVNNAAADRAREAGLKVVMDKCMLKEHAVMVRAEKDGR
ncbi:MAG: CoA-binding protein [Thermoplasmata archaeon]|nr:CoA-binding protein [Thermoplasmata archaeon]